MAEEIQTSIEGLKIRIQKVVGDSRGVLCELAPEGMADSFFSAGVKNMYTSVAVGKHMQRAGHYHHKNQEVFYTLTGCALWGFADFRKGSSTFGKTYAIVVGAESPPTKTDAPVFVVDDKKMAQVFVPSGVYHAYWPLTDTSVSVLAVASEPYNKEDYVYPKLGDVPGVGKILGMFGIEVKA